MKAFTIAGYGLPLLAADLPEPTLGAHDVLVDVKAASINQLDIKIGEGAFKAFLPQPFPLTLGHDVAGIVTATGANVTRFTTGDRVYGRVRDGRIGTFAERIAVAEDDLAAAPTSISLEEAASLPLVALTSWQALVELGNVQPGQKILIHAGAGGVGSIAIQIAKHLGAIVATTVSAANADLARSLGADITIDYRTQDFENELTGFDLVLDSLGGENLHKSLRVLRPGGRAIGISGPPTPAFARSMGANLIVRAVISRLSTKTRKHARTLGVDYDFLWMRASGEQLTRITDLVDTGIIRPIVAQTYPFEQTPEALAALTTGGHPGKIVTRRD
ncbi:NADPH:quinone reductase-like Zn-dependent oxidoreductase [Microbacterium terrae]|uniref:Phenolphthiocerol synthesis polyketide synthase type I Pks15/1 n=1 Tax=Microbacterium terrae TaxID=69369 RepID=A0A0M2HD36_9MICO|nr:NADP-dependent oxidoreductase [Microbacterium terrae]KJL44531.1 Phenolphthiocerol synthesis polyketide synthase type I Pks15/1 [Microbacterium terrae]MBP1079466.1 NADPH:quinone reductase-like Zn-dependent oxidoreductase [Microbacterium terrae]GLJ96807.1 NADPH:quinone oxidoreductase [Microbacterium terrae]